MLKGVTCQLSNGAVEFNCVFIDFLIYLLVLAVLEFRLVVVSGGSFCLLQGTGFSLLQLATLVVRALAGQWASVRVIFCCQDLSINFIYF